MNETHEVDYAKWCPLCEHHEEEESADDCNDCLNTPFAYDSRKPLYFKEADETWVAGQQSSSTKGSSQSK